MGSLADEARALSRKRGPECSIAKLRRSDAATATELDEAMALDLESTVIAEALRKRGVQITYWVVQRHRRGDCSCR